MKKQHVYSIDFLMNGEYSEEDLHLLIDDGWFTKSLIIQMFKEARYNMPDTDILRGCHDDSHWMYKYFWTDAQRRSFRDKLIRAFHNLYQYNGAELTSIADWWLIEYGLTNKKLKNNKNLKKYNFEN